VDDVIAELKSRRRREPFEPFVIVLSNGRRLEVSRRFQYAFNPDQGVVLDERDCGDFFAIKDIARIESLHPVG
jgi:hypothetical protein